MVTGAGGYIGTQLVRDLVKAGHEVTAVDRFFFGKEPLSEFIGNKQVTIKQKDISISEVKKINPSTGFHSSMSANYNNSSTDSTTISPIQGSDITVGDEVQ